ncbi:hypothetical protein ACP4OV_031773 [Aristida adscensionis]
MLELSRLSLTLLLLAVTAAPKKLMVADAGVGRIGLENCPTSCGNVTVPYPFGIRPGCYLPGFNLTCDESQSPARLLLGNGVLQVTDISLDNATVRVLGPDIHTDEVTPFGHFYQASGRWGDLGWGLTDAMPYVLSEMHNEVIMGGCNFLVELTPFIRSKNSISSCKSLCDEFATLPYEDPGCLSQARSQRCKRCSGIACCQSNISVPRASYDVEVSSLELDASDVPRPFWVLITEQGWFDRNITSMALDEAERKAIPVVLRWVVQSSVPNEPNNTGGGDFTCIHNEEDTLCHNNYSSCNYTDVGNSGYVCKCWNGYQGNPYLRNGCQAIDECALQDKCYGVCKNVPPGNYSCECPHGASGDPYVRNGCVKSRNTGLSIGIGLGSGAALVFLVLGSTFMLRKIKSRRKQKQRQRFFKQNRGQLLQQLVSQRADIAERMIISLKELEKATNKFDKDRELGGGGHGVVYKGILSSLHVVAVKKSKIVVQREIDDFLNEVAILSQINHRNIVKLFGCCLETEVPLLVYEFINNGTLYNHLHVDNPISLSWKDRLRVAVETAGALAYLHSYVSTPIIHRDIKSPNILLDDNLTVKLSDFGASRHVPIDQTGLNTVVQGTFGYLDPTYYSTGHLTEKSDVYSFGVILIELLTRKKPVSYRSVQGYGLVKHFVIVLSQGNLVELLDPQVSREGGGEVVDIALLAKMCVKLVAEERPTMRQIEMTLESIYAAKEFVSGDVTDEESEIDGIRENGGMPVGGTNVEAVGIVVHSEAHPS